MVIFFVIGWVYIDWKMYVVALIIDLGKENIRILNEHYNVFLNKLKTKIKCKLEENKEFYMRYYIFRFAR